MVNRLKRSFGSSDKSNEKIRLRSSSARAGHQRWRRLRVKLVQLPMADVMPRRPLNNTTTGSFEDGKMIFDTYIELETTSSQVKNQNPDVW